MGQAYPRISDDDVLFSSFTFFKTSQDGLPSYVVLTYGFFLFFFNCLERQEVHRYHYDGSGPRGHRSHYDFLILPFYCPPNIVHFVCGDVSSGVQ